MVQRYIQVVPYDPNWVLLYEKEAEVLSRIFGDLLADIYHIGSTSVPGLAAKPVVDIMPLVHDIEGVEPFNEAMAALGYIAKGEGGIAGRRFFIKPSETERTHHVHIFQVGSGDVLRHLAFRNYLIAHPAEAELYAKMKIELARQFPEDIFGYMDGKDAWIKATEQKAIAWIENGLDAQQ
jgi:GrpB-like predicted nucleotidyltransferase (UPF0157 family)